MDLTEIWPPFGLELRTPRLLLRPMRDEDLPGLVKAARSGVHDPTRSPFSFPWTDAEPHELPLNVAQFHWGLRASSAPEAWNVEFAVIHEGVVIGAQGLVGRQFAVRRTVSTGSWLQRASQGHGLGREMREAVLQFAFDHLCAERAESAAVSWNAQSRAVSRRLGYRENGSLRVVTRSGVLEEEILLRLDPRDFERPAWTLGLSGFTDAARQWFGVGDA